MQRKSGTLSLQSYDEIFTTEENRQEEKQEKVKQIPLDELHPFKNHPFKVLDDETMLRTEESISQYGILTPAIARPRAEGGYELISGHRRHHAALMIGMETMPVIIRELDDDASILLMVDSNLQRESILPSERAFAYRMKHDALKRQAGRPSKENLGQLVPNSFGRRTTEMIGEKAGDGYKQVQRYIRLTYLIPELLEMVDKKELGFTTAVTLSFLSEDQQRATLDAMEYSQSVPSLSQAQKMKKLAEKSDTEKSDTEESVEDDAFLNAAREIMSEEKKEDKSSVKISSDVLKKYFPGSFTPRQMEEQIIKLLDQWQKKRQKTQEL